MTRLEAIAIAVAPCDRCGAPREASCRTRTGRTAPYAHRERWDVVLPAWRLGYREGGRDAADLADSFLRRELSRRGVDEDVANLIVRDVRVAVRRAIS